MVRSEAVDKHISLLSDKWDEVQTLKEKLLELQKMLPQAQLTPLDHAEEIV